MVLSLRTSLFAFVACAADLLACTTSAPTFVDQATPAEATTFGADASVAVDETPIDAGVDAPAPSCADVTCDTNATCVAKTAGPLCVCNPGYAGNGTSCTSFDPCTSGGNGGCDTNATCTHTGPATRTCACAPGYAGDGMACASIDPCATSHGGCDTNATCTHTGPATSTCACAMGYVGDGTTCELAFHVVDFFPRPGMDLSGSGGYVIMIHFSAPFTLTGTGSATLHDLTANTSTNLPLGSMGRFASMEDYALIAVDNTAAHSPAHTYAVTVSSDLIVGYAGVADTTTWSWTR